LSAFAAAFGVPFPGETGRPIAPGRDDGGGRTDPELDRPDGGGREGAGGRCEGGGRCV
jgi:hypothetical protein